MTGLFTREDIAKLHLVVHGTPAQIYLPWEKREAESYQQYASKATECGNQDKRQRG